MLDSLSAIGIPPNKIRVIFNRVDSNVLEEFPFIIGFCKKEKSFIANTKCAIWENELFDALSVKRLTVDALMKDETDYKSLLKSKTKASEKDRHHWADMFGLKALSKSVKRNLDDVYLELFK